MIARKEWLGCRHDASPMFDIPGSTLVWAPYPLFSDFQDIKTYMYYVFKSILIIKEHWWSLTSSWPDEVQRMFSIVHEFLKGESKPQTIFMIVLYKLYSYNFIMLYFIYEMFN